MARPYGAYIFLAGKTDGNSNDTGTSLIRRYHLIQICFPASLMCASTSPILFLINVKIWTLPCSAVELGATPCHLPSLWSTLCSTRRNVSITAFTGQVLISHLRFQSNEGALRALSGLRNPQWGSFAFLSLFQNIPIWETMAGVWLACQPVIQWSFNLTFHWIKHHLQPRLWHAGSLPTLAIYFFNWGAVVI